MRAYTVDCSGAAPVVTGLQTHLHTFGDFGMAGGNYGPPNYLRLASGDVAVAGNARTFSGLFLLVFGPDGTLRSKSDLAADVYFVGLAQSPDDANTVAVVGDKAVFEVSGLDTPTPTATYREVPTAANAYPTGASSPYFDGPGLVDTDGDDGDPQEGLWAWSLSTFQKTRVGDDNYVQYWPNGNYDLGDGRVVTATYGNTIVGNAQSAPYADTFARFFFVDYRVDPPVIESLDIKPHDLLPDLAQNVTGGGQPNYVGYMEVDELNVGSTSLAADGRKGLVVRGSTVLSQRWATDAQSGDRYSVMVWAMRGTQTRPGDPMPPRATPIYSVHDIVEVPLGTEHIALEEYSYLDHYPYTGTMTMSDQPEDAANVKVGSDPRLTTADGDASYLRHDYVGGEPTVYLGAFCGPWTIPAERTFYRLTIEFDYYQSVAFAYGLGVRIQIGPGSSQESPSVWSGTVPAAQMATGWKTYSITGTVNAVVMAQIAAGTAFVGIKPDYYPDPATVETRLSRLSVKADLLKAP